LTQYRSVQLQEEEPIITDEPVHIVGGLEERDGR
jgi:hypothetical protein